jgi:hypothetical protein
MLISVLLLFCPEIEFSGDVDRQNSETSKPFSGQSHLNIGSKAGRVVQIFGVQLWDKVITELFHFHFFLTVVRLIQIPVFAF